ncbi:hypothetical protein BFN03_11825 [Rhodococcus sp. WMMA185]|uniref:hypothetical protein n=1 Tax=Rhodococcus sp. WMMA185 TaxID=679318 RepID=UPI000877F501|nr:hypothetical protein [Rhodococcus sp. WMMA185]AOW93106.1 hypothetical protein BFN03_11825 [Rhodococcus sp. WMMA185]
MGKVATIAAAAALLAGAVGVTTVSTSEAQAAIVSGTEVRYVFCSDNPDGNTVTYFDSDGNLVDRPISLTDNIGGERYCGSIKASVNPGDNRWASITNYDSPYLYAAIYEMIPPYNFNFLGSTLGPPQEHMLRWNEGGGARTTAITPL